MLRSMTAYGRASASHGLGNFVVEIHSVNRKGLELALFLPKGYLSLDIQIRKLLKSQVERGQVTVRISLEKIEAFPFVKEQLQALKHQLVTLQKDLGFSDQNVSFPFLLEMYEKRSCELCQESEVAEMVATLLQKALTDFHAMRLKEGEYLKIDLLERLLTIELLLDKIEQRKTFPLENYAQRLTGKLLTFSLEPLEIQDKLLREVALLADKLDITEELVRLQSHLAQFKNFLHSEKSQGRSLEFLVQEMGREINTLGSKSGDQEISALVVALKTELEKIKEQVHNLE